MPTIADLRKANPWSEGMSDMEVLAQYASDIQEPLPAVARYFGVRPPEQNTGFGGDMGTALKQGTQQLPGALTGIGDIITAPLGDRLVSRAADWVGEKTGVRPGMWARDAEFEYSPQQREAEQAVNQAWERPQAESDIWKALAENPRYLARQAVTSLPTMVGGGLMGAGVRALAGRTAVGVAEAAGGMGPPAMVSRVGPALAAGVGEGAFSAGQTMSQIDPNVDPRTAAMYAAGVGTAVGAIGGGMGALARKAGVLDIETALAGQRLAAGQPLSLLRSTGRVLGGIAEEGLLEEAPQSYIEQVGQNLAEGKPWQQGAMRAAVEGGLVGGALGGGANVVREAGMALRGSPTQTPPGEAPPAPGAAPAPTPTPVIDPAGGPTNLLGKQTDQRAAINQVATALSAGTITEDDYKRFETAIDAGASLADIQRGIAAAQQEKANADGQGVREGNGAVQAQGPAVPAQTGQGQAAEVTGQGVAPEAAAPVPASEAGIAAPAPAAAAGEPAPAPVYNPTINAAVASHKGTVTGKVSMPREIVKGLARYALGRFNKVTIYPRGQAVPVALDPQNEERLQRVGEMIRNVQARFAAFESKANAIIPTSTEGPKANLGSLERKFKSGKTGNPNAGQPILDVMMGDLRNTQYELVRALRDLESEVGAKTLDALAYQMKRLHLAPVTQMLDKVRRETSADVNFSVPWAMYKDGAFNTVTRVSSVRGRVTRLATEAAQRLGKFAAANQSLVKAAKGLKFYGRKNAEVQTGVFGVLTHYRQHGTALEKVIANAVYAALSARKAVGTAPQLAFKTQAEMRAAATKFGAPAQLVYHGFYNPGDNTIYLPLPELAVLPDGRTLEVGASPETVLHEALHAALQWFIEEHPTHGSVIKLANIAKNILNTPLTPEQLGKAGEQLEAIRNTLPSGKPENNNVAGTGVSTRQIGELVSYALTTNGFQDVLDALPSMETAPQAQSEFAGNLSKFWQGIKNVLHAFLGGDPRVADVVVRGDVVDTTWRASLLTDIADQATELLSEVSQRAGEAPATSTEDSMMALSNSGADKILEALLGKQGKAPAPTETAENTDEEIGGDQDLTMDVSKGAVASLLGQSLYGKASDSAFVTVKELFQNAVDALKGAIEKGQRDSGTVKVSIDDKTRTITVKDDGVGMSPDVVRKAFFTLAGSYKETTRPSGGFGVAKMQFLSIADKIKLVTVKDGIKTTVETTGKAISNSFATGSPMPEGTRRTFRTSDPNGTTVEVTLPKVHVNNNGVEVEVDFPYTWTPPEALRRSPLFENITLQYGKPGLEDAVPTGKFFPNDDYVPLATVHFSWGNAAIIVSKKPVSYGDAYVLSNGVWQFNTPIKPPGKGDWDPNIPYEVYIDLQPAEGVTAHNPSYPIAMNRQDFSPTAKSDMSKIIKYISAMYGYTESLDRMAGYGNLKVVRPNGKIAVGQSLVPPVTEEHRAKGFNIQEGATIVVKDGRMYMDGKLMPELTKEELDKFQPPDLDDFKVDQKLLDASDVLMHEVTEYALEDDDGNVEWLSPSEYGLRKFGVRFAHYLHDFGELMKTARDVIATLEDYEGLAKLPMGVTFDDKVHGVHSYIPFSAILLRPYGAAPRRGDRFKDSNIASAMIGTMVHEAAHLKSKNHNETDFIPEMQNLFASLSEKHPTATHDWIVQLTALIKDNKDIYDHFTKIDISSKRISGQSLGGPSEPDRSFGGGVRGAGGSIEVQQSGSRDPNTGRDQPAGKNVEVGRPSARREQRGGESAWINTVQTNNTPTATNNNPYAKKKPDPPLFVAAPSLAAQGSPVPYLDEAIKDPLNVAGLARKPSIMESVLRGIGYTAAVDAAGRGMDRASAAYVKAFPAGAMVNDFFSWGWSAPTVRDAVSGIERLSNAPKAASNAFAQILERSPLDKQDKMLDALDSQNYAGLSQSETAVIKDFRDQLYRVIGMVKSLFPPLVQIRLETAKPSELLYYTAKHTDIFTSGFSADARKAPLAGRQSASIDVTAIKAPEVNGVKQLVGERFYAVTAADPAHPNDPAKRQRVAMVHESLMTGYPLNTVQDEKFDLSRAWFFDGKGNNATEFKFASTLPAKEAQDINKAATHANAVRNTIDHLAKLAQSSMISKAVVKEGGDSGLVFGSEDDLKRAVPGAEKRVIVLSESKQMTRGIRARMRSPVAWVQLSDDAKWGDLKGKIINGSVWAMLDDMHTTFRMWGPLDTAMRWFKKNKTVYSLGTHIINVGTNVAWMYMHDIPAKAIYTAAKLYWKAGRSPDSMTANERAIWRAFSNSGAMLADYSSSELKHDMEAAMNEALSEGHWGVLGTLGQMLRYRQIVDSAIGKKAVRGAQWVDDNATGLYSAEDNIFRLGAFMSEVGKMEQVKGSALTEGDIAKAGEFATEAFLDYNIHAIGINALKATILPFVSWPYRAIPLLAKTAIHKPWKIPVILGFFYTLDMALAGLAGGDDEEERKLLPAYMNQRIYGFGPHMYMKVPFLGTPERPVYFKFGAFAPAGDLIQDDQRGGFIGLSWWPQIATPNGPFITAVSGMVLAVNPFTGQKITKPLDDSWEAHKKQALWMAQEFLPPAAKDVPKMLDSLQDKQNLAGNKDMDNSIAIARAVGLRFVQTDLDNQAIRQAKVEKAIMSDYRKELAALRREANQFPNYDPEKLAKKEADLRARMARKLNYELNRESEPENGDEEND